MWSEYYVLYNASTSLDMVDLIAYQPGTSGSNSLTTFSNLCISAPF